MLQRTARVPCCTSCMIVRSINSTLMIRIYTPPKKCRSLQITPKLLRKFSDSDLRRNVLAVVHRPSPIATVVASGDSRTILDVDAPRRCLGFMVVIFAAAIAFLAIFDMWSTLHLSRSPALVLENISGRTEVASCGIYSKANCSGSADRCMNSRK